jgi:basic membrane lipoprotein Med (substrate-binding protein (PBP1-ABC) superfamily)
VKRTFAAILIAAVSLFVAACGSSKDGGAAGGNEVKVFWLYTGPANDGGYNVTMRLSQEAMDEVEGVETAAAFEVPYSQRATQIAEQAVAQGNNALVDTLGLGALFTDVCRQNPDVYCFPYADGEKQPSNSNSFAAQDWDLNYIAGVAAGLMTETDVIGFNGSFDIPLIRAAVNSYALGCQSVNPDCTVRVIYNNAYFDPTKEAQAAKSLVDAGADVLRNWVDSTSFCTVAEEEGVFAVGEFTDFSQACPDSIIVSTIWNFSDYLQEQAKSIRDGNFKGGNLDLIEVGDSEGQPHMTDYGDFVPDDVRAQTDAVWDQLVAGDDLIVGPITDSKGNLMFKDGEAVPHEFMVSQWDWYVDGVVGG